MNYEFNRHAEEFDCDFTIEFDVKCPTTPAEVPDDIYQFEYETGAFTNAYAAQCFDEICKLKTEFEIIDWSFAGRSNGWFVLMCNNSEKNPPISDAVINRIVTRVEKYFKNYGKSLAKYYQIKTS